MNYLVSNIACFRKFILALGWELGKCRSTETADNSDQRDHGKCNKRQLPCGREPNYEAGHESRHVMYQVPQLQFKKKKKK